MIKKRERQKGTGYFFIGRSKDLSYTIRVKQA